MHGYNLNVIILQEAFERWLYLLALVACIDVLCGAAALSWHLEGRPPGHLQFLAGLRIGNFIFPGPVLQCRYARLAVPSHGHI